MTSTVAVCYAPPTTSLLSEPTEMTEGSVVQTMSYNPVMCTADSAGSNQNSIIQAPLPHPMVPKLAPPSATNESAKLNQMSTYSTVDDSEASRVEDSFVRALAAVLTHLVSLSIVDDHGQITRFHAVRAPDITINDYLNRIQKYFGCSNECFVLSLIYIDRIVKLHEGFTVSILNIHRLLITSVMLAAKFFDDVYYSNAFYARVGGVRTQEINLLEWQFLALINYRLFVAPKEYDQYRRNVIAALHAGIPQPSPALAITHSLVEKQPCESDGSTSCSKTESPRSSTSPSVQTSPIVSPLHQQQLPFSEETPVAATVSPKTATTALYWHIQRQHHLSVSDSAAVPIDVFTQQENHIESKHMPQTSSAAAAVIYHPQIHHHHHQLNTAGFDIMGGNGHCLKRMHIPVLYQQTPATCAGYTTGFPPHTGINIVSGTVVSNQNGTMQNFGEESICLSGDSMTKEIETPNVPASAVPETTLPTTTGTVSIAPHQQLFLDKVSLGLEDQHVPTAVAVGYQLSLSCPSSSVSSIVPTQMGSACQNTTTDIAGIEYAQSSAYRATVSNRKQLQQPCLQPVPGPIICQAPTVSRMIANRARPQIESMRPRVQPSNAIVFSDAQPVPHHCGKLQDNLPMYFVGNRPYATISTAAYTMPSSSDQHQSYAVGSFLVQQQQLQQLQQDSSSSSSSQHLVAAGCHTQHPSPRRVTQQHQAVFTQGYHPVNQPYNTQQYEQSVCGASSGGNSTGLMATAASTQAAIFCRDNKTSTTADVSTNSAICWAVACQTDTVPTAPVTSNCPASA